MARHRIAVFAFLLMTSGASLAAFGQGQQDPATLIAAQREAMAPLAFMDGVWRGPAWTILPSGQKHTVTQTERIGPFLDGSVKVIEGRGYEPDGGSASTRSARFPTIPRHAFTPCTPMRKATSAISPLSSRPMATCGKSPQAR